MADLNYLKENAISFIRGDTFAFAVELLIDDDIPYELKDTDKLVFTVKKSTNSEKVLIQKNILSDLNCVILHSDTANLDFGKYVYDIQLTQAGGVVQTPIGPAVFELKEEVNWDE